MTETKTGVDFEEFTLYDIPVLRVHVLTEEAAEDLKKPCGTYTTLTTGLLDVPDSLENIFNCLVEQLRPYLEPYFGKPLCICGIGNRDIPADSLGPEVARRIAPNFSETLKLQSNFSKVAVICPGVFGKTNFPTEKAVSVAAAAMNAACVLTIDATVTQGLDRLCSTIQLTDAGMDNRWQQFSLRQSSLGVPVVSIGVPTAIPLSALPPEDDALKISSLTPSNIGDITDVAAFVIACAITKIIYPALDYEDCKKCIELFAYNIPPT